VALCGRRAIIFPARNRAVSQGALLGGNHRTYFISLWAISEPDTVVSGAMLHHQRCPVLIYKINVVGMIIKHLLVPAHPEFESAQIVEKAHWLTVLSQTIRPHIPEPSRL
jgi:hypothetical protein